MRKYYKLLLYALIVSISRIEVQCNFCDSSATDELSENFIHDKQKCCVQKFYTKPKGQRHKYTAQWCLSITFDCIL